ncbi:MAG: DndE family protein [Oscillibacter sp.]|jgi:DNA sulfur modification protein DndE|nr:DndE family protein [Oscillibacter sp.]
MIFKLKTSAKTAEIFEEIGRRSHLKPYTLVKHAIAWSLKEGAPVDTYRSDTNGLELNRQTITGEYDIYFKVLMEQAAGRQLTESEYFPHYVKAHIDQGALILESKFKHAGNLDRYILESLGVGDTV